MEISQLLAFSVKSKASDLHLSAGLPPMLRVHGEVRRLNLPVVEHKEVLSMVYDIMTDAQRQQFEEKLEADFAFEIEGVSRFRINAFNQLRGIMTIPEPAASAQATLAVHRRAEDLFEQLRSAGLDLDTLSMGMSADLEAAIQAGSTLVRVGSAIFGARAA